MIAKQVTCVVVPAKGSFFVELNCFSKLLTTLKSVLTRPTTLLCWLLKPSELLTLGENLVGFN
jgi:hypothetical protein